METQTLTQVNAPKGHKDIGSELKKEAQKSKAFNDVCTVFALRERARSQVTVNSLKAAMDAKKFTHSKEDYVEVLATMARLGLGTLHRDSKSRIKALVNVKYSLQSIGLTAVGENLSLSPFSKTKRFSRLPAAQQAAVTAKSPNEIREKFAKMAQPVIAKPKPQLPTDKTVLVGNINGQVINIPLTDEQFTQFLVELSKR